MIDTMGLILNENNIHINGLTEKRSVAALPIAGRYRLIDFIMSNMVNSNIINVGVVTRNNYSSLMDHLGSGKEWDLNRKNGGLHILPPYIGRGINTMADGNIDMIGAVGGYIRKSNQKYVLLTEGTTICNMTFDNVLAFHEEKQADITIVYNVEDESDDRALSSFTILNIDEDGRVTDIEEKPRRPKTRNVCMGMFFMDKGLLQYMVDEATARGEHDFIKDILIKKNFKLNIYGYRFDGYVGRISSIKSYYGNNMRFLEEKVRMELFNPENPIYTKVKDQVPTRYGETAVTNNCLVADGCTIEGDVENSIIFRGVFIGKGAKVKNSIIMQDSVIQSSCELNHVVMDKEVTVREGRRLIGDANYPMIISKGAVV
jgi:glucose-1-phosphate adenylyltransferase